MTKIRIIFTVFGIGLIVYLIFVGLHVFSPSISDFANRTEFVRETWIGWEETESTLDERWNMVNDLVNNYELKGKSISQIKEFLGEPSFESKNEINYNLGATGHGINYGTLSLKLNNGIVSGIDIWQG